MRGTSQLTPIKKTVKPKFWVAARGKA